MTRKIEIAQMSIDNVIASAERVIEIIMLDIITILLKLIPKMRIMDIKM